MIQFPFRITVRDFKKLGLCLALIAIGVLFYVTGQFERQPQAYLVPLDSRINVEKKESRLIQEKESVSLSSGSALKSSFWPYVYEPASWISASALLADLKLSRVRSSVTFPASKVIGIKKDAYDFLDLKMKHIFLQNRRDKEFSQIYPLSPEASKEKLFPQDEGKFDMSGAASAVKIALVLTGLGRQHDKAMAAIGMFQVPLTLGFIPYGSQVNSYLKEAHHRGHETILMLPMEPYDFPENDPGPSALLTGLPMSEIQNRLTGFLAGGGRSFQGVTPYMGSRFLLSERDLTSVMKILKARGLYVLEGNRTKPHTLRRVAEKFMVPCIRPHLILTPNLTPPALVDRLQQILSAKKQGEIIVILGDVNQIALEDLQHWIRHLKDGLAQRVKFLPLSETLSKKDASHE